MDETQQVRRRGERVQIRWVRSLFGCVTSVAKYIERRQMVEDVALRRSNDTVDHMKRPLTVPHEMRNLKCDNSPFVFHFRWPYSAAAIVICVGGAIRFGPRRVRGLVLLALLRRSLLIRRKLLSNLG